MVPAMATPSDIAASALSRAVLALEGLSTGDAFGQCFFDPAVEAFRQERKVPDGPWHYTDDTEMSLSVVDVLARHDRIEQDDLAKSIAGRYSYDRAYGPSMHRVLAEIRGGRDWRVATRAVFEGQGSYGNGAAMRAAPVGAYFAGDRARILEQAALSAEVTHAHPEAIAGSIAVALAADLACRLREGREDIEPASFIDAVLQDVPDGEVRSRLRRARDIRGTASRGHAAAILGCGIAMSAPDTVPYALWCAATLLRDYESALWLAIDAGGDRDTLAAIVGGIVACRVGWEGIPVDWRSRREPWPAFGKEWPFESG